MPAAIKRILAYFLVSAACYAVAIFYLDEQIAFVAVFGSGFAIALAAELMFWRHLYRVFRRRSED